VMWEAMQDGLLCDGGVGGMDRLKMRQAGYGDHAPGGTSHFSRHDCVI